MGRVRHLLYSCALLGLSVGCGGSAVAPLLLYEGAPRPTGQISIIRIVKTNPKRGHPTLNVRKITRLDAPSMVVFQASQAEGWQIPAHFAGPPDNRRQGHQGNPRDLPSEFRVEPGTYQIDFLYVPAVDRWGWTHVNRDITTARLVCQPGMAYVLEGKLLEDGNGWFLSTLEEKSGVGKGG